MRGSEKEFPKDLFSKKKLKWLKNYIILILQILKVDVKSSSPLFRRKK
jgi:hypothetical protein